MKVGTLVTPDTDFLKSGWFNLYTDARQCGRFYVGEIAIIIGLGAGYHRDHMVRIYTCSGAVGNIPRGNLKKI